MINISFYNDFDQIIKTPLFVTNDTLWYVSRLFRNVVLPPSEKPQMKVPSKLKEALKVAKQQMEQRLRDEQKLVGVTWNISHFEGWTNPDNSFGWQTVVESNSY